MTTRRDLLFGALALGATSATWTATLSTVLGPRRGTVQGDPADPVIRGLLERQLALLDGTTGDEDAMRATNPEWDFMGRAFLGLALCNLAIRAPAEAPRFLAALDGLIADTAVQTSAHGDRHWLLPYAGRAPFRNRSGASLFVDGELAALVAARRIVGGDDRFDPVLDERIARIRAHLDGSPLGHGESYPDECWAFCNAFAAVALTLDQAVRGGGGRVDHRHALARWRSGLDRLVDPGSGMLLSSYTYDGEPLDGPEGSSLHLVTSHLALLDPALGRAQYALSREHLLSGLLGFGWSREWPAGWRGPVDVDSGPIIPILDASPGASGLAFVSAGAYDPRTLRSLLASLELAGFPTWDGDRLSYAASNPVGDAVLLYALVQGPLWRLVRGENA